jgi:hypothetical protein
MKDYVIAVFSAFFFLIGLLACLGEIQALIDAEGTAGKSVHITLISIAFAGFYVSRFLWKFSTVGWK